MIHTIRTVAVGDQESKIDSPIILYRGDREVEVEFTINGSKFTFTNGGNVIKSTNATHGQLVINTPTGENMFSEVTECHDGKVVFVITKEMIDELIEVGFYSFQIRLFDESQVSRVTIPPVIKGIDIRNPIAAEDETNVVDISLVDYAVVVKDEFEDLSTFLPDGNYNKTEWESKDVISGAKLNKIEDALYNINSNMEATDLNILNNLNRVNIELYSEIKNLSYYLNDNIHTLENDLLESMDEVVNNTNESIYYLENRINEKIKSHHTYVKDFGAKGDGITNDTYAVEEAMNYLNSLGGGVLIFTDGVYRLDYFLLYPNVWLDIRPRAILKSVSGVLCSNFSADEVTITGYNGRSNISIFGGGTIDMNAMEHRSAGTVVQFGHCHDIYIENITFTNIADDHAVEFVGVKDFGVKNCKFLGYKDFYGDGSKAYKEAIQIDFSMKDHGGGGVLDGTPCVNGVIDGCIFDISDGMDYFPAAIGSHGVGVTKRCDNITIRNCVINGCKDAGIVVFNWSNSLIENNKIFNHDKFGIMITESDDIVIKSNHIDGGVDGIGVYDCVNVILESNTVRNTQKHGTHITDNSSEVYVIDNIFKNNNLSDETYSAIAVGSVNESGIANTVTINGNTILSDNEYLAYGIDVRPTASNVVYENNVIYAKVKTKSINDRQNNYYFLDNRVTLYRGSSYEKNIKHTFNYTLDMFDEYEITVSANGVECMKFLATEMYPKIRTFNLADSPESYGVNFYEMNVNMYNNGFEITSNLHMYWDGSSIPTKTDTSSDGSGMIILKIVGVRYDTNKIPK